MYYNIEDLIKEHNDSIDVILKAYIKSTIACKERLLLKYEEMSYNGAIPPDKQELYSNDILQCKIEIERRKQDYKRLFPEEKN